jgi:hypothetical protein
MVLVAFGLGQWAYARYGIKHDNVFSILLGLAVGWCTWRRPWWFWHHPKAALLRGWVGDGATTIIYGAIALWLVAIGLFGQPRL